MRRILNNWNSFKALNEAAGEDSKPIHIFFDMDGVLVDFGGAIADEMNKNIPLDSLEAHPTSKSKRKALRNIQKAGITRVTGEDIEKATLKKDRGIEHTPREKVVVKYLTRLLANNKPLWVDMKVAEGAHEMVDLAKQIGNVHILSSPFDDDSVSAKHEWLQRHFPNTFDKIFIEGEKGQTIVNTGIIEKGEIAILIDDRVKTEQQLEGTGAQLVPHRPPASKEAVAKTLQFLRGLLP